jgi:penicillin G amidase
MKAITKKIIIIGGMAAGLLIAVAVAVYITARQSASYEGSFRAGVKEGVDILRDAEGNPFIKASSWGDAFFALGCVHARDRLAQMEYYRAISRGELSELVGQEGARIDRLAAIIGFSRIGAEILGKMDEPYRGYLESYARGVSHMKRNALRGMMKISNIPSGDWGAADAIAVLLTLEWANAYLNNMEFVCPLPDRLKSVPVKDIVPDNLIYWYDDAEQKNIFVLREIRKIVLGYTASFLNGIGCFVPHVKTSDGTAKLMMNLEGPLRQYPLWYPVSVQVKDRRLDGITACGMPFFFSGGDGAIQYMGFSCRLDSQDFYLETTRETDKGTRYYSQGIWKEFESVAEGKPEPVNKKKLKGFTGARSTDHGPVISDIFRDTYRTDVISLRQVMPGADYITALFRTQEAASIDAFRRALVNVRSFPRVYLVTDGRLSLRMYGGQVPQRQYPDRMFKQEGMFWAQKGDIDLSANAALMEFDSVVAGDSIFDAPPAAMKNYIIFHDAWRYERMKDLIRANPSMDISSMKGILVDSVSADVPLYIPAFMQLLDKIPVTSARLCRIYFHEWDSRMGRNSVAASIYQVLLQNVIRETLTDELKNEIDYLMENHYYFSQRFLEAFLADKSMLFNDTGTDARFENRDMIFDRAFMKAMRYLNNTRGPIMEEWRWGTIHRGMYDLPLTGGRSYLAGKMYDRQSNPVTGSYASILRGTFTTDGTYAADEVTAVSAIYAKNVSLHALSYGRSLNPFSSAYGPYSERRAFGSFTDSGQVKKLVILPSGK